MNNTEKMVTKDYIQAAIFSVLSMVGMIVAAILNMSGYTALLYPAGAAFFIGILFFILEVKIPKKGAVFIFSIVPALYFFASGLIEGIVGAVGAMLFSLFAEFILSKHHDSTKHITIAAVVYTMYYSTIGFAEQFLFTEYYCNAAAEHGIDPAVVDGMRTVFGIKPLWAAVIAATALTTLLGTLIGRLMTNKHLKRTGLVK